MDIRLDQAYSFHQTGLRDNQEDSRFPDMDSPNPKQRFFIVCDGVGGCDKGEVASQTVCEAFGKALKQTDFESDFSNKNFGQALDAAYNALDGKANDENRDMGTTLTFVCFHKKGCTMAHIGDSRIYQIRPSEGIIYRSDDHSMVNMMVHNGALTPEQAIDHPQSNVITRYMEPVTSGEERCMATVMRTIDIEAGDYFFLCTDGVLHKVSDDELVNIMCGDQSNQAKMQKIADMSKDSEDNNTAYLIPVADVVKDVDTDEDLEIQDGDTHRTKKIKVASQKMEEVESMKASPTKGCLLSKLKNLFKKVCKMKKTLAILTLMTVVCTNTYCAQPSKKNVKSVAVDSTTVIIEKAKAGDAASQNIVGGWYYTGKDSVKQNYEQALQWWSRSAKQKYPEAIANMAMCYQFGHGIKQDSTMAVNLYKSAIREGNKNVISQHEKLAKAEKNIFSCLFLRDCYMKGIGVEKDLKQASYYQELAAEGGHEPSQFAIGLNLLNNKQADKAADWFKKAADQGNAGATYYYGFLLLNGMGVNQDKVEGIKYLEKASQLGFPTADYQLGVLYREGNGTEKNEEKAFSYFKKAAYHGNAESKWELGNAYLNGTGTVVDYYLATQWLAEVALTTHKKEFNELLKKDNEGLFSQYLMGLRKYYVDKDYSEAIKYFTKVEKTKNPEGQTMLGLCYANKDNPKQNFKKAIKTLTKAAENGSHLAVYHLSGMYETGTGVDKDIAKAIELLKKAADAGIARAECRLGDHYMTGNGVSKDLTKAALLYLDAEAQNQLTPQSAKNLAECYKNKISALPDLENTEKRIEHLSTQKNDIKLYKLLNLLEKN